MRTGSLAVIVLLVAGAPAAAPGQTAPVPPAPASPSPAVADRDAAEPRRVEAVVVTATKVETPREQVAASTSVVTEEDFRTFHYPAVDEALRGLPGVDVRRSGSFGKTSAVSIRGANANQVQILVDGVRVKSPTLGQTDLSDLAPDLIDRIEVIRGPQSTIYGADAIGGVVNVITRRGRGPFSATLEQEAGNRDTLRSRATFSGSYRLLDYAVSASHHEGNGQSRNDGADHSAVSARVGVSLPADSHAGVVVRWNRTDNDLPVKFLCPTFPCPALPIDPIVDVNAQQQSETLLLSGEARTRPLPWWESRVRLSRLTNAQGFQDAEDPGYVAFFTGDGVFSQIDVERREAEWVNTVRVGPWSTSTLGLEYRHEEGQNRTLITNPGFPGFSLFRARAHTAAFFFEQQVSLFDRLFLSAGVRVEDHSVFGTETTERGGLAYVVRGWGTRLHGSAGSGFRAPTLNDLFFPGFSNPSLQPERSFSWDVGVEQRLWGDRIRLGLTYFHNRFDNLIRVVPLSAFPFVAVVNVARARAAGVEFTGEVDLLASLAASVAYTYTDSEDLATDRPFVREPRHRWRAGLTWEPLARLSLWVQVHVVTRQFESDLVGYNRGHARVDLGGAWRLLSRAGRLQSLDVTARIDNALDEGYSEVRGFPAPGVQGRLGLRARF